MIQRSWHGTVPVEHGDGFAKHLHLTGIAGATGLQGNLGAFVTRITQGNFEHFFLLTYWDSWESICKFSGPAAHIAVTYPEDAKYGLVSDPIVLHQEVPSVAPWYGQP